MSLPEPENTEFDTIVLGTGLIESILAGSLARAGQTVLHLDQTDGFGSKWRVLSFKDMLHWVKERNTPAEDPSLNVDYRAMYDLGIKNVRLELYGEHVDDKEDAMAIETEMTVENIIGILKSRLKIPTTESEANLVTDAIKDEAHKLLDSATPAALHASVARLSTMIEALAHSRFYNLDLAPKILPAKGKLVEVLIQSRTGHYLDFFGVNDVFIFEAQTKMLEKVPSSKEDVFTTKSIPLIDKRKLMKFLTFAMNPEEEPSLLKECATMNYSSFLEERFKITGRLKNAIIYAISLVDDEVPTEAGLEKTKIYLQSMGRFSKGAYLGCQYGAGSEIAQAFSRVCAVYGGIYMLNQHVDSYSVDEQTGHCTGVVTKENKHYRCKRIVAGIDYLDRRWYTKNTDFGSWISRAILVTHTPLIFSGSSEGPENNSQSYSVIPPNSTGNSKPIILLHFDHTSKVCPAGQYVTFAWINSDDQACLENTLNLLLNDKERVKPLFALHFQQFSRQIDQVLWNLPENVIPCSDPGPSLDVDIAVNEAIEAFKRCLPDSEFMPAMDNTESGDA